MEHCEDDTKVAKEMAEFAELDNAQTWPDNKIRGPHLLPCERHRQVPVHGLWLRAVA